MSAESCFRSKSAASKLACLIILLLVFTSYLPWLNKSMSAQAYTVPNEAKYLVALFDFTDLPHTKSIDELREITVTQVQEYYTTVSYGKLKLTAEVLPNWITLPVKVKEMKLFEWNYDDGQMQTVDATARGRLGQLGIGAGKYAITFIVYAGEVWPHAFPSIGVSFENENTDSFTYCHELGHALGHLPDLYSYGLAEQSKPSAVWLGPWDLMSWSLGGFTSWSLIRLGWLQKNQIVDVSDSVQRTITIDALENATGKTYLARIHLPGSTLTYYVEVREKLGEDQSLSLYSSSNYPDPQFGVLIYTVDGTWTLECCSQSDEGQVKVVDSHPNSNPDPEKDLFDAPFNIGRSNIPALVNQAKDFSIIVVDRTGYAYRVMIANALTGNQANEANNIIASAQDAISKAQIESRDNGLEAAKNQLTKAQSSFSEGGFVDAMQAAKSASEMANAASKNPTVSVTQTTSQQNIGTLSSAGPTLDLSLEQLTIIVIVLVVSTGAALTLLVMKRSHQRRK